MGNYQTIANIKVAACLKQVVSYSYLKKYVTEGSPPTHTVYIYL